LSKPCIPSGLARIVMWTFGTLPQTQTVADNLSGEKSLENPLIQFSIVPQDTKNKTFCPIVDNLLMTE